MSIWSKIATLFGAVALAACQGDVNSLRPGVSTREEVTTILGQPEMEWKEDDGSIVLEFPRGPVGYFTYMVTIGPDNLLRSIRQVLEESSFAKIEKGMSPEEVRRILGKPGKKQVLPLKPEEAWTWRYQDVPSQSMDFHVHFSMNGKVTGTSRTREATSD